jgi:hypothetical protein
MKAVDVTIGMVVTTKVTGSRVRVRVIREAHYDPWAKRVRKRFWVRRLDTNRDLPKPRTAGQLQPCAAWFAVVLLPDDEIKAFGPAYTTGEVSRVFAEARALEGALKRGKCRAFSSQEAVDRARKAWRGRPSADVEEVL